MQTIIITGISRGLGKAFFDYYNKQAVFLVSIARTLLPYQEEAAKEPRRYFLRQDLSCLDDFFLEKIEKVLQEIMIEEEQEVIFINNAGVVEPIGSIGNLNNDTLRNAVGVNVLAPMLLINQFIKLSKQKRFKLKIINISSGAANYPIVGWSGYCSTKAAVKMFLAVLRKQCEQDPTIEIVDVDPGVLDTDMQQRIRSSNEQEFPQLEYFKELNYSGKLNKPDEVVKNIVKDFIKK